MSETAVERRLREMATDTRQHSMALSEIECPQAEDIDAGREALRIIRESLADATPSERHVALEDEARALLARCEGE